VKFTDQHPRRPSFVHAKTSALRSLIQTDCTQREVQERCSVS